MKRLAFVYFTSLLLSLYIVNNGNFIVNTLKNHYENIFIDFFESNLNFDDYYAIKFNEYSIYNMENIVNNAKLYHNTFVEEMFAF